MKTVITIEIRTEVDVDTNLTNLFDNHGLDNFIYNTGTSVVEQVWKMVAQQVGEQHREVVEDVKKYWVAKDARRNLLRSGEDAHERSKELGETMKQIEEKYGLESK
ncbi:MAG TPA: hypothetical protein VGE59_04920 [Patescibacteria group bacterium]